ncbi:hypothetical protein [Tumebacillus permanentifrigoris]|uniref:Uncharacterized protein n=1 Tax=Tumebacillus permanentifrigoris TaxID=378543 RepID=A0A316DWP0_9BACL|nr:hypothetical protein [Tumebacillus permanentifrigoris]PWK14254.1 hypothetical protein C7459_1057 [Tumebacillus permanentifrigoris]
MGKLELWNDFCHKHNVLESGVPLFDTVGQQVMTLPFGSDQRKVLKRNPLMEALVIQEVNKVLQDYDEGTGHLDGLIYMMYWVQEGAVVPLYIGKSEKIGRGGGNLSINIKAIEKNPNFCRWGYKYSYHLGNLSAVVCSGHDESKQIRNYGKWANALFESFPAERPVLKKQTYFWMSAWSHEWTGVWKEFGATSLTFLEYLLIGLASDVFGDVVLNNEGVNRK